VSQLDPAPADTRPERPPATPGEQHNQSMNAFEELVERIASWLVEFGIWVFGSLIAFDLLVLAAVVPVGPVDPTIKISTAAVALSLPLNTAGLLLLRLVQDLRRSGFGDSLARAFRDVDSASGGPVPSPTSLEALRKRRNRTVLRVSTWILALSVFLAVTGMFAVLWHMAWWIAVAFFAMVMICAGIVARVMVASQPPDPEARKSQRTRHREALSRQARQRYGTNAERT
jgi:hypothetical protein